MEKHHDNWEEKKEERIEEKKQEFEEKKQEFEEKKQEFEGKKQEFEEKKQEFEEKKQEAINRAEKKKNRVRAYFASVFGMRDNMMSYEEIDAMMREQTVIHGANMWILMLAILIASIGLNVNSTAVIIGAMLISPLMSGILSMGYSIAVRDLELLRQALVRFGTQVVISLITATIYFSLSPLTVPTEEMIARTNPTIWDVLIALFGGLAGMIGHTRTKHSNVIPGVAIATALMPPLCTAGYGLATGQMNFFLGAFYLFVINTLFIAISTAFITLILRVPYHRSISQKQQRRVNAIIITISVIVVLPSCYIAAKTVHDSFIETNINTYLDREFAFTDTQVVKSSVDNDKKIITVSLVGETIPNDVIKTLEEELPEYNLGDYKLHVMQNVLQEGENNDKVTIVVQENKIAELQDEIARKTSEIEGMQDTIDGYQRSEERYHEIQGMAEDAEMVFPHVKDCHVGIVFDGENEVIVLIASVEQPLEEYEENSIKSWLRAESGIDRADVYVTVLPPEDLAEEMQESE